MWSQIGTFQLPSVNNLLRRRPLWHREVNFVVLCFHYEDLPRSLRQRRVVLLRTATCRVGGVSTIQANKAFSGRDNFIFPASFHREETAAYDGESVGGDTEVLRDAYNEDRIEAFVYAVNEVS